MKSAITWFEIGTVNLKASTAFLRSRACKQHAT